MCYIMSIEENRGGALEGDSIRMFFVIRAVLQFRGIAQKQSVDSMST